MTGGGEADPAAREPGRGTRPILDAWAESLAQVLESMTDERPSVEWRMGTGTMFPGETGAPLLWWEQPLKAAVESPGDERAAGMKVWVAAPRATWEHTGALTLKAAGLEDLTEGDTRNTWFEILGQSLAGMARAIGAALGHEITCDAGLERAPDLQPPKWASATIRFGAGEPLLLAVALAPPVVIALEPAASGADTKDTEATEQAAEQVHGPNVDLLLDVDLPISISFGRTQLALNDVLKLTTGSIVELDSGVNDQVEVLVNRCLVARGEVVVVDGNYGVRILEIVSRRERLRGLR